MKKITLLLAAFVLLASSAQAMCKSDRLPYQNAKLSDDERAADLVKRMTLEEKVEFVTGDIDDSIGVTGTFGIERLGIPNFELEHGPYGYRGWFNPGEPKVMGTFFPVSIAQAATWDVELVERLNTALGREMKASGGTANAGPSMNIIRDARGGRSFEYYTEDPYLNGEIASAHVKGMQSQRVMAMVKHYACNNQEFNRNFLNVTVDERALREIYLPGFKAAIQKGGAWSVMGAYNKVNGYHACESEFLLQEVLREDWGFKGFVGSDWSATQHTDLAINAGLDLELPRPKRYGKALLAAVKSGKIEESKLDVMCENILRGMFWAEAFDKKASLDKSVLKRPDHIAIAREAAGEAVVLLKNDTQLLPLDATKQQQVAIIGPNGDYGNHASRGAVFSYLFQGGGSSSMGKPRSEQVTIMDGVKNVAAEKGSNFTFTYEPGCYAETGCDEIPSQYFTAPNGEEGLDIEIFNNAGFEGAPAVKKVDKRFKYSWWSEIPIPEAGQEGNSKLFSVRWKGTLTAPATRKYTFEVRNLSGSAKIYINDELIAYNPEGSNTDILDAGSITLREGEKYEFRAEFVKTGRLADVRLGWDYENVQMLERALAAAKAADVVVMPVGLSGNMGETENGDRRTLRLAPAQERLINEVSKVNDNVVVVVMAGSAVAMQEWLHSVPSVAMCWYGGQEAGNGLADVLFGKVNPAGRLPITFPLSLSQYAEGGYTRTLEANYSEGIFVGYRYFDEYNKPVLFPFGHGLSYTTFDYSDITAQKIGDNKVKVRATVKNSGKVAGAEVVQLYVHDTECSLPRPKKELKAFDKITLKPGESQQVEFILEEDAFAFWDTVSDGWKVESGDFEIMVGSTSHDIRLRTTIEL